MYQIYNIINTFLRDYVLILKSTSLPVRPIREKKKRNKCQFGERNLTLHKLLDLPFQLLRIRSRLAIYMLK